MAGVSGDEGIGYACWPTKSRSWVSTSLLSNTSSPSSRTRNTTWILTWSSGRRSKVLWASPHPQMRRLRLWASSFSLVGVCSNLSCSIVNNNSRHLNCRLTLSLYWSASTLLGSRSSPCISEGSPSEISSRCSSRTSLPSNFLFRSHVIFHFFGLN